MVTDGSIRTNRKTLEMQQIGGPKAQNPKNKSYKIFLPKTKKIRTSFLTPKSKSNQKFITKTKQKKIQ